jgi:hypothetical protein
VSGELPRETRKRRNRGRLEVRHGREHPSGGRGAAHLAR